MSLSKKVSPAEVKFYFDDQEIIGLTGPSVGAALLANGDRILRKTRFNVLLKLNQA